MKTHLRIAFAVMLSFTLFLCLVPMAWAEDAGTWGNLAWTLDGNGLLTISGNGEMDDFSAIGESAWLSYQNKRLITSVVIKPGVTSVGNSAFSQCENLISVSIPQSVTKIGAWSFNFCRSLKSISLPDSVAEIGEFAFYTCDSLRRVSILANEMSIGQEAFSRCSSLKTAGPIGSGYDFEFGWTSVIPDNAFTNCTGLERAVIPVGVKSIGSMSFYGCSSLSDLVIPAGVTSIGNIAFRLCSSLTDVSIPDGVTSIGQSAFSDCAALKHVTIPASVERMGDTVFRNCNSLQSAGPIGSGCSIEFGWMSAIPEKAFFYCTGLTSVNIPVGITSIGASAFSGCNALEKLIIPGTVTSIAWGAFYNSPGLTSAGPIDSGCSIEMGWSSFIPSNVFSSGNLTSVTIPEGVTEIKTSAFSYNDNLSSVTIPDSVTKIAGYAFIGCENLSTVYYGGTKAAWGEISILQGNDPLMNANIFFAQPENPDSCELDALISVVANDEAFYTGESFKQYIEENMRIRCENDHGVDSELGHKVLEKDKDYTVEYYNQTTGMKNDTTNAGSIKVTVTGINKHKGTLVGYFHIKPRAIQRDWITLSAGSGSVAITVKSDSGKKLAEGTDYTVKDNGNGEIIIQGINNYTSEIRCLYEAESENVLNLPASLREIGEEVFAGCAAEIINIPDGCKSIASRAFADCPNLKKIVFESGDNIAVAEDFVSGCSADLVIAAPEGSGIANRISVFRQYLR